MVCLARRCLMSVFLSMTLLIGVFLAGMFGTFNSRVCRSGECRLACECQKGRYQKQDPRFHEAIYHLIAMLLAANRNVKQAEGAGFADSKAMGCRKFLEIFNHILMVL